jgi:hypothetical protein
VPNICKFLSITKLDHNQNNNSIDRKYNKVTSLDKIMRTTINKITTKEEATKYSLKR